jgi:hypothetical protein
LHLKCGLLVSKFAFKCNLYCYSSESTCAEPAFDYWITDGVYGNFNNIIYDWATRRGNASGAFPQNLLGNLSYVVLKIKSPR